MHDYFNLKTIIEARRTVKPPFMNGKKIPDEQVLELVSLANWAPTHGLTEPWRFIIYAGMQVSRFCQDHAKLYEQNTSSEKFTQDKYDKLAHMGDQASHIIIAIMHRGQLPAIPQLEEIAAASCAVQNILLGATAMEIASYWGSGGMAYHPAMKEYLALPLEDLILGILYLGYTDQAFKARRNTSIEDKITFIK